MVQLLKLALIAAASLSSLTLSAVPAERITERQGACVISSVVDVYGQDVTRTSWETLSTQTSTPTRTTTVTTLTLLTNIYTTVISTPSPSSYTTVLPTSILSSYTTNATLSTWVLSYYTKETVLPTYVAASVTTIINTMVPSSYTTVKTSTGYWQTTALATLYHTYTTVSTTSIVYEFFSGTASEYRTWRVIRRIMLRCCDVGLSMHFIHEFSEMQNSFGIVEDL
ncbi:hypothetical protein L207DRAFT_536841 [Hyaloscypha variabilis F]|uniref:Uncharacterized protein n=1 Tax=Hyaloscypha variabilis (strain UAMH 11265 / GT02V1 / F) TaxID=1149755 RepID=A0A2J6R082_HYAVF|nr:hypothetical protein L207DRAFT_536841 [Hyaloscypha variabilis F]